MRLFFSFFALLMLYGCSAVHQLESSRQMIVVVSEDWNANKGTMFRFTKNGDSWLQNGNAVTVSIGDSGLAWGIGLHITPENEPLKKEGDKRSPAGIFTIGGLYGWDEKAPEGVQYTYKQISSALRCVDDKNSQFYNKLVEENDAKDWSSAERMKIRDYKLLLVVNHNEQGEKLKGSCIFFHLNNLPTSGCTAMDDDAMVELMQWLDESKIPLIVQLPKNVYHREEQNWKLPLLK